METDLHHDLLRINVCKEFFNMKRSMLKLQSEVLQHLAEIDGCMVISDEERMLLKEEAFHLLGLFKGKEAMLE